MFSAASIRTGPANQLVPIIFLGHNIRQLVQVGKLKDAWIIAPSSPAVAAASIASYWLPADS